MQIDLPLFPLGHVVLAPSMPLPLHVFEARYRALIADCLRGTRRFGVVLIREGEEVGETAIPHDVGTVAEITAATELDDGRYGIWTEGRERFRIIERFYDRSYLHATVEVLDEPLGLLENTAPLAQVVRGLVQRYVRLLLHLAGEEEMEIVFSQEPVELSYKVLSVLQILDRERQHLLELASAESRLRAEEQLLRREVVILQRMIDLPRQEQAFFHPN